MRIYSMGIHDDVQMLDTHVDQQVTTLRAVGRGKQAEGIWQPLPVWRLKKPRKRKLEDLCDVTAVCASVDKPVMSSRAKRLLEPVLGTDAQWLALSFEECEYWILNSLRVLDAVDLSGSAVGYFPDGRVSDVEKYALRESVVADEWLFKASVAPYDVLVTERFRSLVTREKLTGIYFQPVWDSAHKPFSAFAGRKEIATRPEVFGPKGFVPDREEFWPVEWKEEAEELKRQAKESLKRRA
jgi:hypothetical protein